MTGNDDDDDDIIDELIDLRLKISETEANIRRARFATAALRGAIITAPLAFVALIIATTFLWSFVDLAPYWQLGGILIGIAMSIAIAIAIWRSEEKELLSLRPLTADLERLHQEHALRFSGAYVDLAIRQYVFRGAVQRSVTSTRKRSDRYRGVHNSFQTVIIVGSLATTTVASLNPDGGVLKWVAVGLSFAVGIAAGFTGYFKYRERAFYLRQTADDLDEQLNAYEVGLPPYHEGSEEVRIALLTARTEAIRVAQQEREQQLDQPKAPEAS